MSNTVDQVEVVEDTNLESDTEQRSADGITIEVESVAGPISIVRTTAKAKVLMQHC